MTWAKSPTPDRGDPLSCRSLVPTAFPMADPPWVDASGYAGEHYPARHNLEPNNHEPDDDLVLVMAVEMLDA